MTNGGSASGGRGDFPPTLARITRTARLALALWTRLHALRASRAGRLQIRPGQFDSGPRLHRENGDHAAAFGLGTAGTFRPIRPKASASVAVARCA
jgi:hypothetical protein